MDTISKDYRNHLGSDAIQTYFDCRLVIKSTSHESQLTTTNESNTYAKIAIIKYAFVRIQKRNKKQNDIIAVRAKVFASIL